jgi:hypothetical protein
MLHCRDGWYVCMSACSPFLLCCLFTATCMLISYLTHLCYLHGCNLCVVRMLAGRVLFAHSSSVRCFTVHLYCLHSRRTCVDRPHPFAAMNQGEWPERKAARQSITVVGDLQLILYSDAGSAPRVNLERVATKNASTTFSQETISKSWCGLPTQRCLNDSDTRAVAYLATTRVFFQPSNHQRVLPA